LTFYICQEQIRDRKSSIKAVSTLYRTKKKKNAVRAHLYIEQTGPIIYTWFKWFTVLKEKVLPYPVVLSSN